MRKSRYIKLGSRVTARSITGQEIIGNYEGAHNNYGCWVRGVARDSREEIKLWHCASLTVSLVKDEVSPGAKPVEFIKGDPYHGLTRDGKQASGYYQNTEGKYIWIRGWLDTVSKFEPKQAIKILRDTARKGLTIRATQD